MKNISSHHLSRTLKRAVLVSAVAVAAMAGTSASAQIVQNGFFQDGDSSSSGYAGYGPISGYTTHGNSSGINGYDVHFYRSDTNPNEIQTQFAPAGYSASPTTDPRDFAFIQNSGDSLTQTLTGLNLLTEYRVTFLVGQRGGDTLNVGTASVTGGAMDGSASVTGQFAFTQGSFTFATGLDPSGLVLTLANTTPLSVDVSYPNGNPSQDRDVDFGDVVITAVGRTGYVPEPSTYALLGLGGLGLLLASRRRRI